MNFRIIEGDYSLYDKAEAFAEYYNNLNYSIEDICSILDISKKHYANLRHYCLDNGLLTIQRKGGKTKNPKYYHWNKYRERFFIYKGREYYACFKTEEEAQRFVELMKEYNWDKSKCNDVKELIYMK